MTTNFRFVASHRVATYAFLTALMMLPLQLKAATDALVFVTDSNWDADNAAEIHLMRPDGSAHRRIQTQYPVSSASMNSTGNWFVYTTPGRKELRLAHISGRRDRVLRPLTHVRSRRGPGLVSWSPDGRRIAYTRYFPPNDIGVEVYDTRTRRFVYQDIFAPELRNGVRARIERLLWSPDSQHFAMIALREDVPFSILRFDYQHIIVASPTLGRKVLDINERASSAPEVFAFASNKSLLVHDGSILGRLDIRSQRLQKIVDLSSVFNPHNIAVSPNGRNLLIDANQISATRSVWNELLGTPRGTGSSRNFAFADSRRLAAAFVTPLNNYSDFFPRSTRISTKMPNFEWRSVPSPNLFRAATCWGWVVTLRGSSSADRIIGTDGPDVIAAGPGNDVINSGRGDDVICAGGGNDVVIGGAGQDIVWGDVEINQQNLDEVVDSGNDRLQGGGGIDALYGNNGDDQLNAGSGNDYLSGGDGDDTLDGGIGFDVLDGGDGTDTCVNYLSEKRCE